MGMTQKKDWEKLYERERGMSPEEDVVVLPEGLKLKPLYTAEDLARVEDFSSFPGLPPFTRGVRASLYKEKPWTIRQYAGFSTPEETNAFYKKNLEGGQRGLSVAFDLATHRGFDSDNPRVSGDVGMAGVAVDTVEDMKTLFEGIPLDRVSVSMTMNGAVLPILAMYIAAAEESGVSRDVLSGTLQNDILKEFLVRNTYIYPPAPSLRIVGDIIAYCAEEMPKFNPVSISGYHMHEAGATAVQELAFTLADGLEYVKAALKRGIPVDAFAPRLSFFFGIGMNFFLEISKLRAARTLWADLMAQFNPKDPRSLILRTHCQTSGVSLTAQDPFNNIVRTTLEALSAVLGGTQSLHTNSFDEALALPSSTSARVALNTQNILLYETGIREVIDPLGGSYYVETLTSSLIKEAKDIIRHVEALGGMAKAIETGYAKRLIEEAAAHRQARLERGEDIIVGVNQFTVDEDMPIPLLTIETETVRARQIERLKKVRENRNTSHVTRCLRNLKEAAEASLNLMPLVLEAVRARATVGEISDALREVFGDFEAPQQGISGVYARHFEKDETFSALQERVRRFAKEEGRQPRMLIAKLGQDGHDRGAKVIAGAFADLGFDVDLAPLFQTPQEVARLAVDNDVHVIGVSSQAGGHRSLVPQLIEDLKARKAGDILVICGGIIPREDQKRLKEQGVQALFSPSTPLLKSADTVLSLLERKTEKGDTP